MRAMHWSLFLSLLLHGVLMALPVARVERHLEVNRPIRVMRLSPPTRPAGEPILRGRPGLLWPLPMPAPAPPALQEVEPEEAGERAVETRVESGDAEGGPVVQDWHSSSLQEVEPEEADEEAQPVREEELPPVEEVVSVEREGVPDDLRASPSTLPDPVPMPAPAPPSLQEAEPEDAGERAVETRVETGDAEGGPVVQDRHSSSLPVSPGVSSVPDREGLLRDYLSRLRKVIEAARHYPDRARRMGQEGRVVIRLVVEGSGGIERVDLSEPSPFLLLNRAAMESIRSLSPLPPLPSGVGDQLEVIVPLVYQLEGSTRR